MSDEAEIRKLIEDWLRATAEGDTATVLGLMADDVIFLVPGQEPFGKKEFEASAAAMQGVRIEGKGDIQELEIAGEHAWVRNHLTITISMPSGETQNRTGHTLSVFKKINGKWLLWRDANLVGTSTTP